MISKSTKYDKATEFGLRPVELLELFPSLGDYFRWFKIENGPMNLDGVGKGLKNDIILCQWYNGYGRRVLLAMEVVGQYLRRLIMLLSQDALRLWSCLLKIVDGSFNEAFWRDDSNYSWFVDKTQCELPDVVYSSITPKDPVSFL